MSLVRKPLPGYKPIPLEMAKMAERYKNLVTSMIRKGPKTVPPTPKPVIDTSKPIIDPPKPAGYGDVPQVRPVSGPPSNMADPIRKLSGTSTGFKKGGKTTTLHSIKKSNKKSNW